MCVSIFGTNVKIAPINFVINWWKRNCSIDYGGQFFSRLTCHVKSVYRRILTAGSRVAEFKCCRCWSGVAPRAPPSIKHKNLHHKSPKPHTQYPTNPNHANPWHEKRKTGRSFFLMADNTSNASYLKGLFPLWYILAWTFSTCFRTRPLAQLVKASC